MGRKSRIGNALRVAGMAALGIGAAPVVAMADVEFPFAGEVTGVSGSYAGFLADAERVSGLLVFDDGVADTNAGPDDGFYPSALVSLDVTLEGAGFGWSANAGSLQTHADTGFGDQLGADSTINAASGYPINGYAIRTLGVLFFGDGALDGDALPASGAGFDSANLFVAFDDDFGTVVGEATVFFTLPEPSGAGAAAAAWAGLALAGRRRRSGSRAWPRRRSSTGSTSIGSSPRTGIRSCAVSRRCSMPSASA